LEWKKRIKLLKKLGWEYLIPPKVGQWTFWQNPDGEKYYKKDLEAMPLIKFYEVAFKHQKNSGE